MEEQFNSAARRTLLACLLALFAVLITYSNHFENAFQFDDHHVVVENPYIRSLKNIPKFFTDARTFSSLPSNQTYRPVVSTSLAIDYYLAGGLHPFWFHFSTLVWYLVQLACMFFLFLTILNRARPDKDNAGIALFASAWYGLHPSSAETVNYIVQRGDLYSTLGVVSGLLLYARYPRARRSGLYLLPVILGALAKPPALMFAPILFAYVFLFEERQLLTTVRKCLPAFSACLVLAAAGWSMNPNTLPTGAPWPKYVLTQTYMALYYFESFFLPVRLSADTDLTLIQSPASAPAIAGMVFLLGVALLAWRTAATLRTRPICFGIVWFLLALVPTSLMPLSEVENDHRMFFPFVGLVLAVCWAGVLLIEKIGIREPFRGAAAAGAILFLLPYAYGAHRRNSVWHTEESLWHDVTVKSPRNGRGLMNYGLSLMRRGDTSAALAYFQRASIFTPQYPILEINLGIANGALQHDREAEMHFQRALALAPGDAAPCFYYARWLKDKARAAESTRFLMEAINRNPAYLEPRYLLMQTYWEQRNLSALRAQAEQTVRLSPDDPSALGYLARLQQLEGGLATAEAQAKQSPSAERWLDLSLLYHQAGRYRDCITAAQEALKLKPDYAEAFNNIAAGYEQLGQWDDAIQAAQRALEIKPDFQLARNNLIYCQMRKAGKSSDR